MSSYIFDYPIDRPIVTSRTIRKPEYILSMGTKGVVIGWNHGDDYHGDFLINGKIEVLSLDDIEPDGAFIQINNNGGHICVYPEDLEVKSECWHFSELNNASTTKIIIRKIAEICRIGISK